MLQRGEKLSVTERRIFKTTAFTKSNKSIDIDDAVLVKAVQEMENGNFEAVLGYGCVKKRIPISGRGKSGGARTIVAVNTNGRWFFMYIYQKNQMDNITQDQQDTFRKFAKVYSKLTEDEIKKALKNGMILEVKENG